MALQTQRRGRVHEGKSGLRCRAQMIDAGRVRVVAVAAEQTRARVLTSPPLQVRISARGMTHQTVAVGGEADIALRFVLGVQAARAVARLAVGVVASNSQVTLHHFVAVRAVFGANALRPGNLGGSSRSERLIMSSCG